MRVVVFIMLFCSIFCSAQEEQLKTRSNGVYYEFMGEGLIFGSINYEKRFSLNSHFALSPRIGLSVYEAPFLVGEFNVLVGTKHYLELGVGTSTFFLLTGDHDRPDVFYRIGYRYHASKGFLLRVSPLIMTAGATNNHQTLIIPGLSIGYNF